MHFIDLHAELTEAFKLVAPRDRRFCIFGSAVMFLHGLRSEIGDVDLFVSGPLYAVLEARGWREEAPSMLFDPPLVERTFVSDPPAHAFYDWKKRGMQIDIERLLCDPETVQGWPCQPLQQLAMWKCSIAHHGTRPKDWTDVAKIANYLAEYKHDRD